MYRVYNTLGNSIARSVSTPPSRVSSRYTSTWLEVLKLSVPRVSFFFALITYQLAV